MIVGMPAAVLLPGATLVRMSLRTMPDSASAFAMPLPLLLVPSPGYGPPVSSGMTAQVPVVVVVVPVLPVLPVVLVLPVDDVGIVNAIRRAYRLRKPPSAGRMRKIAEPWRPYRSVACWYLWESLEAVPGGAAPGEEL